MINTTICDLGIILQSAISVLRFQFLTIRVLPESLTSRHAQWCLQVTLDRDHCDKAPTRLQYLDSLDTSGAAATATGPTHACNPTWVLTITCPNPLSENSFDAYNPANPLSRHLELLAFRLCGSPPHQ
ncbi:Krueppel-like factor 14 [Fusarium oxysporum f. sp. albedinis]|nr:Krueppel-like factor 14 [Fusarium oxysporum f. sp. albedinis]